MHGHHDLPVARRTSARKLSNASSSSASSRGSRSSSASSRSAGSGQEGDASPRRRDRAATRAFGTSRPTKDSRRRGRVTVAPAIREADREEATFVSILDLLEEQDEFESTNDSDEDSLAYGFDGDQSESDEGSELEEDDDEELADQAPLEDWELENAWMELRHRRLPQPDVAARMLRSVSDLYAQAPTLVHINRPAPGGRLIIVGDLHGHFGDLMHILDEFGEPHADPGGTHYLFNGDFVDRGIWGPEVLLCVYCMKLRAPSAVHLNRGNHEDQQQNKKPDNAFCHEHCVRAWAENAERMYELCRRSFKQLPLCHIIGHEIAVVHGGLPLDPMITLADIEHIDRKHAVPINSCSLMGYPRNQRVKAKRELVGENGTVLKDSPGRLIERVGRSNRVLVRFPGDEAEVKIHGAPELEQDVEICYDSEADRRRNRNNRIFVALLWSDPVASKSLVGPSKRGAGSYFDERVTLEFLRVNGLSFLLRSHEKRQQGFHEEHRTEKHGLLAATVFSASNYPSGAGEPSGNFASVAVLVGPPPGVPLMTSFSGAPGWREPYRDGGRYSSPQITRHLREQLQDASAALADKGNLSARSRVLQKLRHMIYCSRPKLLGLLQSIDKEGRGVVKVEDWARAMRACVVPDDDFPWEWLAQYMTTVDSQGMCNWAAFLARYENALSRRLAERWHGGALLQLAPGVSCREEAEEAWAKLDRNGDGRLGYAEIRPLLRSNLPGCDVMADDDRVYSVLAKMDKDRSGYVDRDEFIRAVVESLEQAPILETTLVAYTGEEVVMPASELSMRRAMSRMSSLLEREISLAGEQAITQCWAATQAVLRVLAKTHGCAASVFQVLDRDADGQIDRNEFRLGLVQLLRGSPLLRSMEQWEPLLWQLVDEDSSGFVSPAELKLLFCVREIVSI